MPVGRAIGLSADAGTFPGRMVAAISGFLRVLAGNRDMNHQALMFGALWIGMTSICVCEQNDSTVGRGRFDQGQILQTNPEIVVQVYNWAAVLPQTLAAAEDQASTIFRWAGVAVSWMSCPLTYVEAQGNSPCIEPCPASRLAVRIIPEVPTDRAGTVLGMALTEGGIYASIYGSRVDQYANLRLATASQILGYAMAHEMGHLLLGPVLHASFGIMRGAWTVEDLRSMTRGALRFSPQQAAVIRQAAMRRMRGQERFAIDSNPDRIEASTPVTRTTPSGRK